MLLYSILGSPLSKSGVVDFDNEGPTDMDGTLLVEGTSEGIEEGKSDIEGSPEGRLLGDAMIDGKSVVRKLG